MKWVSACAALLFSSVWLSVSAASIVEKDPVLQTKKVSEQLISRIDQ